MKLIIVLLALKKHEWRSLQNFLGMYLREESDSYKLFTLLRKYSKKVSDIDLLAHIKEKYFFGYSQKNYLNLYSRLQQIVEEWMVNYDLNENYTEQQIKLIQSYNNRGLYDHANSTANALLKKLKKKNESKFTDHEKLFRIYKAQYYNDGTLKFKEPELIQKMVNHYLKAIKSNSTLYKMELERWGRINHLHVEEDLNILNSIEPLLPDSEVAIYVADLSNLLLDQDTMPLTDLLEALYQKKIQEGTDLHKIVTGYLMYEAVARWNNQQIDQVQALLKIIYYGLESQALMTNGTINGTRFLNIMALIGINDSLDNGYHFVENWIEKVGTDNKVGTEMLAKAMICFYHGEYEQIIYLLRDQNYPNISERIRVIFLLLVAKYENRNQDYEALINQIDTCKRFLKRAKTKLSKNTILAHGNLIQLVHKLAKAPYENQEIMLEDYHPIAFLYWAKKKLKQD